MEVKISIVNEKEMEISKTEAIAHVAAINKNFDHFKYVLDRFDFVIDAAFELGRSFGSFCIGDVLDQIKAWHRGQGYYLCKTLGDDNSFKTDDIKEVLEILVSAKLLKKRFVSWTAGKELEMTTLYSVPTTNE